VGIGVTGSTRTIFKVERKNLISPAGQTGLVAIRAGYCDMSSSEGETSVAVVLDRKRRTVEVLHRVAVFATIPVRRGGELIVMRVLMAIRAGGKLHSVNCVFPRGRVAFLTSDSCMFSFQWIVRGCVLLHAK